MRTVPVLDLTGEAFTPYGEVFAPAGVTQRVDQIAVLQNRRPLAKPNLFMARTNLAALPHPFDKMESHPHSSQSFLPFGAAPMLLAVALPGPDGQPDPSTLKAFLGPGIGFSYQAGIWHLPIASLGDTLPVAGFMYEDGSAEDCIWAAIEPISLVRG
jgi:ureidoglycolate lyase